MSQSTTSGLPGGDRLGAFEVDTQDGTATVEIIGSPNNPKRVDVHLEDDRRWIWGAQNGVAVLIMQLNAVGSSVDADVPAWMEPIIQRTGLEGIDA